MHDLVRRLGTSHTGFFHQSVRRVPARLAIGATFSRVELPEGTHWVAQDVHAGGPAHAAGLTHRRHPEIGKRQADTSAGTANIRNGGSWSLEIQRGMENLTLPVLVPMPRSRRQPYCEPDAVSASRLDGNVGYLKVSIFPGLLGLGVARDIDAAVAELSSCDRLIVDLRGTPWRRIGRLAANELFDSEQNTDRIYALP